MDSREDLLKVNPGGSKAVGVGKEGVAVCTGRRRLVKSWKPRKVGSKMVLGRDVVLQEVSFLSLCALVGRFSYWAL